MEAAALCLTLTPHGRLVLTHDAGAPPLQSALADRLLPAFERGSGHGLLLLGADEVGAVLPPVLSFWREFGGRYVTALCTEQVSGAAGSPSDDVPERLAPAVPPIVSTRQGHGVVRPPPDDLLDRIALAAPPMMGAEYLTAAGVG